MTWLKRWRQATGRDESLSEASDARAGKNRVDTGEVKNAGSEAVAGATPIEDDPAEPSDPSVDEEAQELAILLRHFEERHNKTFDDSGRSDDVASTEQERQRLIIARHLGEGVPDSVTRPARDPRRLRVPPASESSRPLFPPQTVQILGDQPWASYPLRVEDFGVRPVRALRRIGIATLGDLAPLFEDQFMSIRGAGVLSLEAIRSGVASLIDNPDRAMERSDELLQPLFDHAQTDQLRSESWYTYPINPSWLPPSAFNSLSAARIRTLGHLTVVTAQEVLKAPGMTSEALEDLRGHVVRLLGSDGVSVVPSGESVRESLGIPSPIWTTLEPWLGRVRISDPWFGLRAYGSDKRLLGDLLNSLASNELRLRPHREEFRDNLIALARRIESPAPLLDELAALVGPADRDSAIFVKRMGWDGNGPQKLAAIGLEFDLTRERIRQIVSRVVRKRLRRTPFLPTLNLILDLVDESGGAMKLTDLAASALGRGLVRQLADVAALRSVVDLELTERTILLDIPAGYVAISEEAARNVVVSEDPQDTVRQSLKREIARRGVASVDVVGVNSGYDAALARTVMAEIVANDPGLAYVGGAAYVWRPGDTESAVARRVRKLLVTRGPLRGASVARALRRDARKRSEFGVVVPAPVLDEVLTLMPGVQQQDGQFSWVGPQGDVSLGVAERAVLTFLGSHGPAAHTSTLQYKLAAEGIDPVTLGLTLGTSLLIDRVAPAIYTAMGEVVLPSDIEDARNRRVRELEIATRVRGWSAGRFDIELEVHDLTLWNGFVPVPIEAKLDGTFTLRDDDTSWKVVVAGGQLRNGVKPWMRANGFKSGSRLLLSLDLNSRYLFVEPILDHG